MELEMVELKLLIFSLRGAKIGKIRNNYIRGTG